MMAATSHKGGAGRRSRLGPDAPAHEGSSINNRVYQVAKYAILSRLFIWIVAVLSHALIQDYDSALDLILSTNGTGAKIFKGLFGVFLRWDSFYFIHIAETGYVFEQEHAFFPLLPLVMRLVSSTVLLPLKEFLSSQQVMILAGAVVANASFVLAAVQIYRLSNELFRREGFAYLTALLYILTPSGIFMSAIYTESLFAALSFTGMLCAAKKQYLLAALCWSASSLARSNGVLYAGFFIYDLVVRADLNQPLGKSIVQFIKAGIYCAITAMGMLSFQYYGYTLYCTNTESIQEARPWCSSHVPLMYSFVQEFYWNVGFLRYYEVKQIPNFLMAAPMLTLSFTGVWTYLSLDMKRLFSLGRRQRRLVTASSKSPFQSTVIFPYIILWAILLAVNITTMHIQIITRAFSCLPPVYWFAAHLLFDQSSYSPAIQRGVSYFFVMYGLIGIVLFANFFPPA